METKFERYQFRVLDCVQELAQNHNGASESGALSILVAYYFLVFRRETWREMGDTWINREYDEGVKHLVDVVLNYWVDEIPKIRSYVNREEKIYDT